MSIIKNNITKIDYIKYKTIMIFYKIAFFRQNGQPAIMTSDFAELDTFVTNKEMPKKKYEEKVFLLYALGAKLYGLSIILFFITAVLIGITAAIMNYYYELNNSLLAYFVIAFWSITVLPLVSFGGYWYAKYLHLHNSVTKNKNTLKAYKGNFHLYDVLSPFLISILTTVFIFYCLSVI